MKLRVSIIIPCWNARDKIGRCLSSLRAIDMPRAHYEVVFVDDCSTDGTLGLLKQECAKESNWHVLGLEANSGSPSRPRNEGVARAAGEFIFFLDCDDEILPDTLRVHYAHAAATQADILRGYLLANDSRGCRRMNELTGWRTTFSRQERIREIIAKQSTTCVSLIRADLLRTHSLSWPEDIRMGEDSIFLVRVLTAARRIEYIEHATFIYNKTPALTASSTQSYGARELRDHLRVWNTAQELLAAQGVDYIELRLQVALQTVLSSLIFRNRGDIDAILLGEFAQFLRKNWSSINSFNYSPRNKDILAAACREDLKSFFRLCRPRLLIAGFDLKFITSILPAMEQYFDVRVDEWDGHDDHDVEQSRSLLQWAELIWCEWLLGNAVWYAANKRPHQHLVVRMHRFELTRDFGERCQIGNVDAVVSVSVHFMERLLERFPSIPRAKGRLIPNYVNTADYRRDFHNDRLYTLGMIGILPARKGLHRALNILARLRTKDKRYRLEIFSMRPEELPWMARNKEEMAYFDQCTAFIQQQGLQGAVSFRGYGDVTLELAKKRVGVVLSTSDSEYELPGSESFHLAVADGFASGGVSLILDWIGAQYIWPQEFILPSEEAIAQRIGSYSQAPQKFMAASERGRKFIENNYSVAGFVRSIKGLFEEVL